MNTQQITIHDRAGTRVVPLYGGEVLPRPIPTQIVDPYAATMPQATQFVVRHEVTPETRAKAMLIKTTAVTLFLALLTLAAMLMLDRFTFLLWLLLASGEWVLCFVLLAILDWRETPSALQWRQTEGYLALMQREQAARLQAIYGINAKELDV